MNGLLENIMNFINENTVLLIIICVFLICVLIGYLIDNSIKTKKLEKQMIDETPDFNDESVKTEIVNEDTAIPDTISTPSIDPNTEINLDFRTQEEKENDNTSSIDPNMEINLDFRTEEEKSKEILSSEEPTEPIVNDISVDPAINDLLLRDFTNNGVKEIEEEKEEVSINPIENISSIEVEEEEKPIIPTPTESVSITPVTKEEPEESVYKNDKKLSDIFKKKKAEPILEKTADYNNELDKILKKLNEASNSKDSTLEETQDFTNMF